MTNIEKLRFTVLYITQTYYIS